MDMKERLTEIIAEYYDDKPDTPYEGLADYLLSNGVIIPPVKHGKWIPCTKADYNFECSICGYGCTDNRLSYCYDCGAKMKEVIK